MTPSPSKEDADLPWDPLWAYFLGDDRDDKNSKSRRRSRSRGRPKEKEEEKKPSSFFEGGLSGNEENPARKSNEVRGRLKPKKKAEEEKATSNSFFGVAEKRNTADDRPPKDSNRFWWKSSQQKAHNEDEEGWELDSFASLFGFKEKREEVTQTSEELRVRKQRRQTPTEEKGQKENGKKENGHEDNDHEDNEHEENGNEDNGHEEERESHSFWPSFDLFFKNPSENDSVSPQIDSEQDENMLTGEVKKEKLRSTKADGVKKNSVAKGNTTGKNSPTKEQNRDIDLETPNVRRADTPQVSNLYDSRAKNDKASEQAKERLSFHPVVEPKRNPKTVQWKMAANQKPLHVEKRLPWRSPASDDDNSSGSYDIESRNASSVYTGSVYTESVYTGSAYTGSVYTEDTSYTDDDRSEFSYKTEVSRLGPRKSSKQDPNEVRLVFHAQNNLCSDSRDDHQLGPRESQESLAMESAQEEKNGLPTILEHRVVAIEDIVVDPRQQKYDSRKLPTRQTAIQENRSTDLSEQSGIPFVCRSVRSFAGSPEAWSKQTGIPISELSAEERAALFPKLRTIPEDQSSATGSTIVIGHSWSFEENYPAHLQASFGGDGPQSLLEYEYENNIHMKVIYEKISNLARSSMSVVVIDRPPVRFTEGTMTFNRVVVQVEASTVSKTDCLVRKGLWWGPNPVPLPNTPGVDFAGKIFRIDDELSSKFKLKTGDQVMSLVTWGGNSRYLSVDPAKLVKVPSKCDPAEAVCLAESYLSAFQVLHHNQTQNARYRKNALKGKHILVLGSLTSNCGKAIAQLANCANVRQLYCASKEKHFDQLTMMGVIPLNKDPLDWFQKLESKLDLVIALEEEPTPLHYKLLKPHGEVIIVTQSAKAVGNKPSEDLVRQRAVLICNRSCHVRHCNTSFYDVFREWDRNTELCKRDLAHMLDLLKNKKIAPPVLDRIPLTKVARAQELMESKRVPGFIVCEPWLMSKTRAIRL